MTMKITDVMDQIYVDSVTLTAGEIPAADEVLALTRQKLGMNKKSRVPAKAFLIAAVVAALGITAGAVGYSLHQATRIDLGISDAEDIPEYVEYPYDSASDVAASETDSLLVVEETVTPELSDIYVSGAKIELISALCAGNRVTAYLSISPVTSEMAEIAARHDPAMLPVWNTGEVAEAAGGVSLDGISSSGRQVEYDAETQTALVRYELEGDVFSQTDAFTVGITWENYESDDNIDYRYFGTVTIPITPAEEVHIPINIPYSNDYLDTETAVLTDIAISANHITCNVDYQSFDDYCAEHGEDAWQLIGDAYWGYYRKANGTYHADDTYNELDAQVAYHRSWSASFNSVLEDAVLTLSDGTEISLDKLQPITADSYTPYFFELPTPVSLAQVKSVTIDGITYSVGQGE